MPEILLNRKYEELFKQHDEVRYYVITGGRGSGKSFATATWLAWLFNEATMNFLYLRAFLVNASISIIPQFMSQLELLGIADDFRKTKQDIVNKNGARLYFRGFHTSSSSADANLKSLVNLEVALIDEASEVKEAEFNRLDLTLRSRQSKPKIALVLNPATKRHWIWKRFFEQKDLPYDYQGVKDDTLYVHTTFEDNLEYLADSFLREQERVKEADYIRWQNDFAGMWLDEDFKAVFTNFHIKKAHEQIDENDKIVKTIIAVDPAVTASKDSDATGIIVASKTDSGSFIIEEEATGVYQPSEWAAKVAALKEKYEAAYIVYEANQGGLLVEETIRNACGPRCICKSVTATKGKVLRAEPIVALYEEGKVKHRRWIQQLEKEMVTFTGSPKDKSPNSLDAAVWALTDLSKNKEFRLQWG